ncbi:MULTISPECIES: oxidoreductase [Pseudonocardia]|uniref:Sorbitol dehydrogenase n=2 Tax=Pseudonocardia TaxID=1847 RepID=A0A1Y2MKL0_PSEAH|nr:MULTISPECIES: oxidoreductase [Pseudonocardia]OSY35539.1 Sorbitol dehydrogenase [Pseudonocardia autotrophica]TDN76336.1 NAD(P)-dependent dehydrogenase (short-subunit alcohol dehydrogenase family) [Pseudonocardia autotrophica]BBG00319.1 putative short-chain dehydrogenase/reductase [Pseudonocardia autotrophica]GEC27490.1 putative short-chain dehydrogenase/reductase [Pseudonocardia saturnea]
MFWSSPAPWTTGDIPPQHGRTAVVTGATSGLGLETARALVRAGARVVLAVRDTTAGEEIARELGGAASVHRLDLADLTSVRECAASIDGPVDVLVNNAGVMALPRARTTDGFEMQLAVNFLGHFALTGLLADRITDRVVTLSSQMHRLGRIDLDDLNFERRRYERWAAYCQSKLACLMFAYELEHRFVAAGSRLRSTAAHPGFASTNLQGRTESFQDTVVGLATRVVAQPAAAGALPTLFAATVTDLPGGAYIGPDGFAEGRGNPRPVGSSAASHDRRVQRALWERAEELTKVGFPM